MDIDAEQERLLEDIVKLAASRKRSFKPITVLIDGPSGSGKTWTAATLADRTNWRVVHLDEFYPGWHGLEKGSEMVGEQVLRTMNPGYWRAGIGKPIAPAIGQALMCAMTSLLKASAP